MTSKSTNQIGAMPVSFSTFVTLRCTSLRVMQTSATGQTEVPSVIELFYTRISFGRFQAENESFPATNQWLPAVQKSKNFEKRPHSSIRSRQVEPPSPAEVEHHGPLPNE